MSWSRVKEWEAAAGCSDPKLLKFQGRPKDISPKAYLLHLLGSVEGNVMLCYPLCSSLSSFSPASMSRHFRIFSMSTSQFPFSSCPVMDSLTTLVTADINCHSIATTGLLIAGMDSALDMSSTSTPVIRAPPPEATPPQSILTCVPLSTVSVRWWTVLISLSESGTAPTPS
jgi:hypothetical protein